MSNKIIGNTQTLQKIQSADSRSLSNYVPNNLSDLLDGTEYIAVASEVKYNPNKIEDYFSPIGGGNVMPKTEFMYKVGEARGVNGIAEVSQTLPIYEMVDWNRLAGNDPAAVPEMVKFKIGYKASKQSWVLEPDGSRRISQVWEVTFNVWDRCCKMWSDNPGKYKTPSSRRAHIDEEMKFAEQKASYKAHSKTIRQLAGMPTGYKKGQLTDGWMTFHKIQSSPEAVKMDRMARRAGMARGSDAPGLAAGKAFGPEAGIAAAALSVPAGEMAVSDTAAPPDFQCETEPPAPAPWEILRDTIGEYLTAGYITEEAAKNTVTGILAWCEEKKETAENSEKWADAVTWLYYVEDSMVPDGKAIDHGLPRP